MVYTLYLASTQESVSETKGSSSEETSQLNFTLLGDKYDINSITYKKYYYLKLGTGLSDSSQSKTDTATIGGSDCTLSLTELSTHYRMFEPCQINFTIYITPKPGAKIPSALDIQSFFSNTFITYLISGNKDSELKVQTLIDDRIKNEEQIKEKEEEKKATTDQDKIAEIEAEIVKLQEEIPQTVNSYVLQEINALLVEIGTDIAKSELGYDSIQKVRDIIDELKNDSELDADEEAEFIKIEKKLENIEEKLKNLNTNKEIYDNDSHTLSLENTELYLTQDRVEYANGENFVCHSIDVSYKNDSSTTAIVSLQYCSPDIRLTTSKYCKAFTKKSLKDIFTSSDLSTELDAVRAKETHITRDVTFPYLVQYNESLYAFLRRTAFRCGEFLYFDRGKLQLGLEKETNNLPIIATSSCISIKYPRVNFTEYKNSGINKAYTDGTHKGESDGDKEDWVDYEDSGTFYNSELNTNEYLATVSKEYTEPSKEGLLPGPITTSAVSTFLSQTSLADSIAKASMVVASKASNAEAKAASGNNNFNDDFKDVKPTEDKKAYYLLTDESSTTIDSAFYLKTEALEREALNGTIELQFGSSVVDFYLGKQVKLDNGDDRQFVMTDIKQVCNSTQTSCTIQLTPAIYYTGDSTITTRGGTVIENNSNKLTVSKTSPSTPNVSSDKAELYPCYIEGISVRHSDPQTAFVAACDDPMRLGRVRIRYPWQNSPTSGYGDRDEYGHKLSIESDRQYEGKGETMGNDISPWIRVSTPSAMANKGGFFFSPRPGDEVLVNYIGGNVEHPYVAGSLFSKSHKPQTAKDSGFAHCDEGAFSIAGSHGHRITITEENDSSSFLNGFNGILSCFGTWFSHAGIFDTTNAELAGAISMGDKNGITNISLNSGDRAITIKSPLGDISMSAFTGISIKAPNGDIKIEGQNVTIKAGNKVKIESGTNIKNRDIKGFGADVLKDVLVGVGDFAFEQAGIGSLDSLLDISIVRTLFETIIRPVNGKLTLQSGMDVDIVYGGGEYKAEKEGWEAVGDYVKDAAIDTFIDSGWSWFHDDLWDRKYYTLDHQRNTAKLNIVNSKFSAEMENPNGIDNATDQDTHPNTTVEFKAKTAFKQNTTNHEIKAVPDQIKEAGITAKNKVVEVTQVLFRNIKQHFNGEG